MGFSFRSSLKKSGVSRFVMAVICLLFALLAFFASVWPGNPIEGYLGTLLVWTGILEVYDGFRRSDVKSKKSAFLSGAFSIIMASLLLNAETFQTPALLLFIILVFVFDAIRYLRKYTKELRSKSAHFYDLMAFGGNALIILFLIFSRGNIQSWTLSVAIFFRILGISIHLFFARTGFIDQAGEDVVASMGFADVPYVMQCANSIEEDEGRRAPYDRAWIIMFILLLFFIHLGRMGLDRTYLGLLSPTVAVFGDLVIALVISYGILGPVRFAFSGGSRRIEWRMWKWVIPVEGKVQKKFSIRSIVRWWLKRRMRSEIRFKKASYSFHAAIRTGLRMGLPMSALLAAIMPVLGMSWYFDTENWASGVWDSWAATRADTWRMAITKSSKEGFGSNSFRLHPTGVNEKGDFSFIVIGDPGEGDASQLILKDQLIEVSNHPEVKFVVISSDVIYPSGALKDYEKKFWLPFKGVHKPVFAIPGNHDYYDALDGFIATFYEPAFAKRAMTARINKDLHITSTTENKINEMIAITNRWRKEYEVPTGFQKAPYFQISTDDFVFITVETGVERQIDSLQRQWLVNVLDSSKGKFVMVLLGHPFYAVGEYQGNLNPDFESIHQLLRKYKVPIAMAGDTHDLEYYQEPEINGDHFTMHHFVNGGGGAYLSIGAAMADPDSFPTKDYAFYPSHNPLVKKINDNTAWYKYPAWWWTKQLHGWPFSAEWLSAMFDYNVSPYFQSFMEIKVMPSKKQVVLIPYSNHGRIKWSEMTSTSKARPAGVSPDTYAEWTIPM